jgi:hypothetical protein
LRLEVAAVELGRELDESDRAAEGVLAGSRCGAVAVDRPGDALDGELAVDLDAVVVGGWPSTRSDTRGGLGVEESSARTWPRKSGCVIEIDSTGTVPERPSGE